MLMKVSRALLVRHTDLHLQERGRHAGHQEGSHLRVQVGHDADDADDEDDEDDRKDDEKDKGSCLPCVIKFDFVKTNQNKSLYTTKGSVSSTPGCC